MALADGKELTEAWYVFSDNNEVERFDSHSLLGEGSLYSRLVYILTELESAASLHTNNTILPS